MLANGLAARGRHVGILSFHPAATEYYLDHSVVKVYGPQGPKAYSKLKQILWIRRAAKTNSKAVFISFEYFINIKVLFACLTLPNRVIASERNDPARVGTGFPRDPLRKLLYQTADRLVCQTDEAAGYFSDKTRKAVIMNPLTPNLPDPIMTKRRKTVVSFCRLEPQKNLDMLVKAFATFHIKYPEYTLEIYGEGSQRSALSGLIDSLGLRGVARIMRATQDIHEIVRDCSMFVLPSHYEGLSNSMIEAMALGLPTICTDSPCGGARMVIQDGQNGILVPVDDTSGLLLAMERVAADETYATRIGEAATEIRSQLSQDTILSQWEDLIFSGGGPNGD
nr:glycosyltransferase [Nesterenkonia populi]